MDQEFDVVVVGCGIAGLSAAVTAQQAGARVAVLERAPEDERGGNTRYTESFWRMKSEDEVSDDFEERFAANAGGYPDPEILKDAARDYENWPAVLKTLPVIDPNLIAAIAEDAPKALKWLKSFGVKWDFLPIYFVSQSTTRIGPIGGGWALIEALGKHADAVPEEITFFYETAARDLLFDDTGAVVGVSAIARGNRPLEIKGRSVVLASGGFEGNAEMQSHYFGAQAQFIRPIARGGHYNRGEGVRMALKAGAAPCGDFGSFHAQPVDPRSGDIEPVVLNYAYGILVNKQAKRFTDEAPDRVDATYEAVTREILKQPQGIAYAIHDAGLDTVPGWQKTVRSRVEPYQSDTIEGLAEAIGLDATTLKATVDAYNAACGDPGSFDPMRADGLATSALDPAKSNYARPITTGPYRAWPIIAANCFTFGGVKVDTSARVVNTEGDAIPGLYAAGEVVGLYYRTYTGATSVMRGAVTGRLAGNDAALRRNS
jgi:tricarballylate dehydrogenase